MTDYSLRNAFNEVLSSRLGSNGLFSVIDGFKRTDAEIAAGIIPTNYTVPSHDLAGVVLIERYGGADDNSTLNDTPLLNALKVADQFDGLVVTGSGISKFAAGVVIGATGYGRRIAGVGRSQWSFSVVGAGVDLVTLSADLNDLSRDQPQFDNVQIVSNGVGRDGLVLTVGNKPLIRNVRINSPVRDGYVESVTGLTWIEKGVADVMVRSAGRHAFRQELLGTAGQNPFINERHYYLECRGVAVTTAGGTALKITGSAGLGAAAKLADNVYESTVFDAIYNAAAVVPGTSPVVLDTVTVENPTFHKPSWENTGTGGNPGAGPAIKVTSGAWGSVRVTAAAWNSFWGDGTIDAAITSRDVDDFSFHRSELRGPSIITTTAGTIGAKVVGNTTANTQPDFSAIRTGAAVNAVGQGGGYLAGNDTTTTYAILQEYNGEFVVYTYSAAAWAERARILPAGGIRIFNFSAVYSGTGVPGAGLGANGDYYFRQDTPGTANQRLYVKAAGAWAGIL